MLYQFQFSDNLIGRVHALYAEDVVSITTISTNLMSFDVMAAYEIVLVMPRDCNWLAIWVLIPAESVRVRSRQPQIVVGSESK